MKVSWENIFPIYGKIIQMFQTTNQLYKWTSFTDWTPLVKAAPETSSWDLTCYSLEPWGLNHLPSVHHVTWRAGKSII